MAAEWFYGKDNKQHGPVSAAQLKQLAQAGKLSATDLVWREGMDEWTPASKVKGLFDTTASAPPAARPEPSKPEQPANQAGGHEGVAQEGDLRPHYSTQQQHADHECKRNHAWKRRSHGPISSYSAI